MRQQDIDLFEKLTTSLVSYSKKQVLSGIQTQAALETFVAQLLESIHRDMYISMVSSRKGSEDFANPINDFFNPLRAAIFHHQSGNIDEAFWLIFLLTHFGRHRISGWHYVRSVYGRLGGSTFWNWDNTSVNPIGFRTWLHNHKDQLRQIGTSCGFGNHRKYESLEAFAPRGTGAAVESYIGWVGPTHSHKDLMDRAYQHSNGDPRITFDYLYHSMREVVSFGRTARFDYLTIVGLIGLASIKPPSLYLRNSTGPLRGARLLFAGDRSAKMNVMELETLLAELDNELGVGMRALEDALCNWQKSPEIFKKFRG